MPAVSFESPLLVFLRPELARANSGSGVVLDRVMRGLPENPANPMSLRAFEL
jgi:hypothetical protein